MWRVITGTFAALTLFSTVATAQQPCTSNANRVVTEVYRNMLERGVDQGAQPGVRQLASGEVTVKELVRRLAKSQEYMQGIGQQRAWPGQAYQHAVSELYRDVLGREPDENGLRTWMRTAQQRGIAAVVDGLIDSQEYNNNFGDWTVPGSAGLRFCANEGGQSSELIAPRFRALDRNNDGVITLSEWDGSEVAFDNRDSNGDGVISGQELRAEGRRAGRRANAYDFDALDINNNNRIERREWQARLDEFNGLNTNGDNFLTRDELEGTAPVGTSGRAIVVGGDRQWVDTRLDVQAGDMVSISASGQIRVARDGGVVAASGVASGRTEGATMPNANVGGLVARFGNSAPVFIGENRTFRAPRVGRL